jgi:hypothetical protein
MNLFSTTSDAERNLRQSFSPNVLFIIFRWLSSQRSVPCSIIYRSKCGLFRGLQNRICALAPSLD